ncbi:GNAT family N-acetyltransferase [Microtetraspora fusca]|uniref:GNAT family N-acetyltransferase n=1 Tax=Microtetraspora fusca TaxID=1997 RepID=UPI00083291E4|nr:GNAT family N-acetyltransferase [Microtetraspora fusca]
MVETLTGVRVTSLHGAPQLQTADQLLRRVWNTGDGEDPPVALDVMCVLDHIGGYVAGAFLGEELVGAAVGLLAAGESLHSHVTGIAPEAQGRGIGRAIKEHQRRWAAERGLRSISWTFDPLVRRNAYFNLVRLGARAERYLTDFYGPLTDGINDGDVSDRLFAEWHVDGRRAEPSDDGEARVILDSSGRVAAPGGRAVLKCATPADIERMRLEEPGAARYWRAAQREALGGALAEGYRVTGFTRDGWYVLERAA